MTQMSSVQSLVRQLTYSAASPSQRQSIEDFNELRRCARSVLVQSGGITSTFTKIR